MLRTIRNRFIAASVAQGTRSRRTGRILRRLERAQGRNLSCAALVFTLALALGLASPARAAAPAATQSGPSLGWSQPSGQGVALGLDVVAAPNALQWDVSVLVPFNWLLALRLRPVLYRGLAEGAGLSVGGKVEVVVRSRVLWNFVRVYGGCGPDIFFGLSEADKGQVDGNWFKGSIDGNWFAGAEVFFHPRWALHWEFGTSGGAFETGAGGYTDIGLQFYLR